MAPCPILCALCVGISEYSCRDLSNLPGARRDAERFAVFLRGRELPAERLYLLLDRVTKRDLEQKISEFMQLIRSSFTGATYHLVVIFIAAHGRHPHSSELPAILPSDIQSPDCEDGFVDLDRQLLLPLDSTKSQKLKVWLVVDTCRDNHSIGTWTGNEQPPLRRSRWSSQTDFHILLACDRGRFAKDDQSLADCLIHSLDDPGKDWKMPQKRRKAELKTLRKATALEKFTWRLFGGSFAQTKCRSFMSTSENG